MFDRIVDRQLARRAARRGAFACVAAVVEVAFGAALTVATVHLARRAEPAPLVEVTFVRVAAARPAPPPPPPPPLATGGAAARRPSPTPRPAPVVPARLLALRQPRVVPDVAAPVAGGGGAADEDSGGVEGGVVGGVPGGVVGGVVGGVLGAERWGDGRQDAPRERPHTVADAPQYFAAGFRRPAELAPGCVRGAIRLPPDLEGTITTQLTVKFAVGRDGRVGAAEFLTPVLDPRVREAVLRALASCRWSPALDATGAPVALWVVLPIRFVSE